MYPNSLLQWLGYIAVILTLIGLLVGLVWVVTHRDG